MVWAPALSELQRACWLAPHHTLKLHSTGTGVLGMPQPGVPMPAAALCSVFNPPHISGRSAVGSTSSLCAQRTAHQGPSRPGGTLLGDLPFQSTIVRLPRFVQITLCSPEIWEESRKKANSQARLAFFDSFEQTNTVKKQYCRWSR